MKRQEPQHYWKHKLLQYLLSRHFDGFPKEMQRKHDLLLREALPAVRRNGALPLQRASAVHARTDLRPYVHDRRMFVPADADTARNRLLREFPRTVAEREVFLA